MKVCFIEIAHAGNACKQMALIGAINEMHQSSSNRQPNQLSGVWPVEVHCLSSGSLRVVCAIGKDLMRSLFHFRNCEGLVVCQWDAISNPATVYPIPDPVRTSNHARTEVTSHWGRLVMAATVVETILLGMKINQHPVGSWVRMQGEPAQISSDEVQDRLWLHVKLRMEIMCEDAPYQKAKLESEDAKKQAICARNYARSVCTTRAKRLWLVNFPPPRNGSISPWNSEESTASLLEMPKVEALFWCPPVDREDTLLKLIEVAPTAFQLKDGWQAYDVANSGNSVW
jgi:hypothetical protein